MASDDETISLRVAPRHDADHAQRGALAVAHVVAGAEDRGWRSNPKLISAAYSLVLFALGLLINSLGPALLALGDQTGGSTTEMGSVFTVRSIAYMIGSMLGGYMLDHFDGNRSLALAMLGAGIGTLLIPTAPRVWTLALCVSTAGLAMGIVDTGANVMLLWLHGEAVGPYMQAMHFCFAVGALASPLVLRLAQTVTNSHATAFVVFGGVCLSLVAPLCLLRSVPPRTGESDLDGNGQPGPRDKRVVRQEWLLVLSAAWVLFMYVGLETGFGGFIVTYDVKGPPGLSEGDGQFMSSVYWGAIAVGRGSSIWAATRFTPTQMLVVSVVGSAASAALMLVFHAAPAVLWFGSATFGLCMACIFPTVVSLAETFMRVQGKHASVFVIGAGIGEMIIPTTIAFTIDNVGSVSFLVIITVGALLQILSFWLMVRRGSLMKAVAGGHHRREGKVGLDEIGSDQVELVNHNGRRRVTSDCSSGQHPPTDTAPFGLDSDIDLGLSVVDDPDHHSHAYANSNGGTCGAAVLVSSLDASHGAGSRGSQLQPTPVTASAGNGASSDFAIDDDELELELNGHGNSNDDST